MLLLLTLVSLLQEKQTHCITKSLFIRVESVYQEQNKRSRLEVKLDKTCRVNNSFTEFLIILMQYLETVM